MAMSQGSKTKVDRFFRNTGEEQLSSRVKGNTEAVLFAFANGHELEMPLDELSPDMQRAAMAFGLNTSVGNVAGPLTDTDEIIEACTARFEQIKSGQWSSDTKTGPTIPDLTEAWVAFRDAAGVATSDERRAAFVAGFSTEPPAHTSKDLLANPNIRAQYDAIKARRAEERARKSMERAKGQPTVSPDNDALLS